MHYGGKSKTQGLRNKHNALIIVPKVFESNLIYNHISISDLINF